MFLAMVMIKYKTTGLALWSNVNALHSQLMSWNFVDKSTAEITPILTNYKRLWNIFM